VIDIQRFYNRIVKKYIFVGLLIFSFLFLRLWRIEERVNFSMDQGMFLLRAKEIWDDKELTLLGPTASPVVDNKQFFQGPAIYYSLIGVMLLSSWDPIRASIIMVILSGVGVVFLYLWAKIVAGRRAAAMAVTIATFLTWHIRYSNFLWNPNFLLLLTPVFGWLAAKSEKAKKWIWFWGSGLVLGLMLQYHYQVGIIVGGYLGYLIFKKTGLKDLVAVAVGAGVGYLPIIVFELRNNFYNSRIIFQWIVKGGSDTNISFHYFLVLMPFILVLTGAILNKLNRVIVSSAIAILIGVSVYSVVWENQAWGMPKGWNYKKLEKAANIVENQAGENFNIVNLLSGDTRFYSLRYILEIKGRIPRKVSEYENVDQLFLVGEDSGLEVANELWEAATFNDADLVEKWNFGDGIFLHEFVKQ
jgi:hypothetical protein